MSNFRTRLNKLLNEFNNDNCQITNLERAIPQTSRTSRNQKCVLNDTLGTTITTSTNRNKIDKNTFRLRPPISSRSRNTAKKFDISSLDKTLISPTVKSPDSFMCKTLTESLGEKMLKIREKSTENRSRRVRREIHNLSREMSKGISPSRNNRPFFVPKREGKLSFSINYLTLGKALLHAKFCSDAKIFSKK